MAYIIKSTSELHMVSGGDSTVSVQGSGTNTQQTVSITVETQPTPTFSLGGGITTTNTGSTRGGINMTYHW